VKIIGRMALGGLIAILLLSGCAGLRRGDWPQRLEGIPPQVEIASVPFFAQEEYQCGPAALAMALNWSGLEVSPAELKEKVYTAALQGSLQPAMITGARRYGRLAYVVSGTESLIRELSAGHPVIVLQNLGLSWMPVWHYAVVIGYDLPADELILHSGRNAGERVAMRVFQNTWSRAQDWGLLILNPSELPATAEEEKFVEAVLGLEKAKQAAAAVQGYRSALNRWPHNLAAMMGMGNSYFAMGNLKNSEAAFRLATEAYPEEGAAFNNLAHVLLEQGRREEALTAAQRAVSLGGPHQSVFQKTLQEIQAAGP
jgi:tetratricopeptide (TPR) repeat protein